MRFQKNLKKQTNFFVCFFCFLAFFLTGCSTSTVSVRPSFDENYDDRTRTAIRASYKQKNERAEKKEKKPRKEKKTLPSEIESQEDNILAEDKKETAKKSVVLQGGEIKKAADKYLGVPYLYGGITPNGFDCSGFVWRVFQDVGRSEFPRTSAQLLYDGSKPISHDLIREGDLCFFYDIKNRKRVGHVGIYIGDGEFIHSSSSKGVIYSKISDNYWKNIFAGYKRFLP